MTPFEAIAVRILRGELVSVDDARKAAEEEPKAPWADLTRLFHNRATDNLSLRYAVFTLNALEAELES